MEEYLALGAAYPLPLNQEPLDPIVVVQQVADELGGRLTEELALVAEALEEHLEVVRVEALEH